MRRLILLVLLAIASPVWVLVRVSFGYKLLITLFISNALLGAYAYYVMERNVFEIPGLVPAQEVPPLLAIYVGSLFLWAVQIVFFITRRLAVLTNTLPAPDPWSAGGFALGRPGSGAFDIPATMAVLGGTYFFVISPDTVWSDVDMALAIIISSAFLVTVYVARTNENTLPLLPLFPGWVGRRRPILPQLATLRESPRPMRDDLSAIFSRRDQALADIANASQKSD